MASGDLIKCKTVEKKMSECFVANCQSQTNQTVQVHHSSAVVKHENELQYFVRAEKRGCQKFCPNISAIPD